MVVTTVNLIFYLGWGGRRVGGEQLEITVETSERTFYFLIKINSEKQENPTKTPR